MAKAYFKNLTSNDIRSYLEELGYVHFAKEEFQKVVDTDEYVIFHASITAKTSRGVKGNFSLHVNCQNFECEIRSYSNFFGEKRTTLKADYAQFLYEKLKKTKPSVAKEYKRDYNQHVQESIKDELII